jgi:hypothetical protein
MAREVLEVPISLSKYTQHQSLLWNSLHDSYKKLQKISV